MELTTEELMRPRYRVIADYPKSPWIVGEVLFVDNKGELVGQTIGYVDYLYQIMESEVLSYPAIFQPLQWWEYRKPEEMPRYVKWFWPDRNIVRVAKVEKWECLGVEAKFYSDLSQPYLCGVDDSHATEAEYQAALTNTPT